MFPGRGAASAKILKEKSHKIAFVFREIILAAVKRMDSRQGDQ